MISESTSETTADGGLSKSQLRSIVRISLVVVVFALAVPFYYGLVQFAPSVATVVPASLPHAATGVSLFVGFPGAMVYARVLKRRDGENGATEKKEYGVNDAWERRNL
ncbi:MAG: hypothetical protein ABEJ94_10005 [Halorientalis sp.]